MSDLKIVFTQDGGDAATLVRDRQIGRAHV